MILPRKLLGCPASAKTTQAKLKMAAAAHPKLRSLYLHFFSRTIYQGYQRGLAPTVSANSFPCPPYSSFHSQTKLCQLDAQLGLHLYVLDVLRSTLSATVGGGVTRRNRDDTTSQSRT